MRLKFKHHYTRDEAQALLPQVRQWLDQVNRLRKDLEKMDNHLGQLLAQGQDVGGPLVNRWIRCLSEIKGVLEEFQKREIQIKDLDRGLLDFPALYGGREIFLCWEQDEDTIEFWHELDTGYAGRERL